MTASCQQWLKILLSPAQPRSSPTNELGLTSCALTEYSWGQQRVGAEACNLVFPHMETAYSLQTGRDGVTLYAQYTSSALLPTVSKMFGPDKATPVWDRASIMPIAPSDESPRNWEPLSRSHSLLQILEAFSCFSHPTCLPTYLPTYPLFLCSHLIQPTYSLT